MGTIGRGNDSSLAQDDLFTDVGSTTDGHRVLMAKTDEQRARQRWDRALEGARTSGIVERIRNAKIIGTRLRGMGDEHGDENVVIVLASGIPSEREAHIVASGIHYDLKAIEPILNIQWCGGASMMAAWLSDMADYGVPRHINVSTHPQFDFFDDQMGVGLRVGRHLLAYERRSETNLEGWSVVGLIGNWTDNFIRYIGTGENRLDYYIEARDGWIDLMAEELASS